MNYKEDKKIILLLAVICLLMGGVAMLRYWPHTYRWKLAQGEKPVTNPLKGWACWGENFTEENKYSLAYVPIYWGDLEPEEGKWDFQALEEKYHFREWRAQGTRLIFRVVADDPTEDGGLTIPEWLYEAMDGDGTWYDSDYGKGFSPNYENPVFKEAHSRLLAALGEHYNKNEQVAYIQLGSLGHWGEWHVDGNAGIPAFPNSSVTDKYVRDYLEAFPDKKLLMRRPYAIVSQEGLGLYDDTFGEAKQHQQWMDWIENGYISDQNGQELPGAPEFWKKAPSGGEIASYRDISWYFQEGFADTLSFIRESHTTYLGPKIPREKDLSPQGWENAEAIQQEMGYCFTIKNASLKARRGADMQLSLDFENIGIAPFYEDWAIRFTLKDETGTSVWTTDVPTQLSQWGAKESVTQTLVGTEHLIGRRLSLWVGIADPMTGTCTVELAVNQERDEDGRYLVGKL